MSRGRYRTDDDTPATIPVCGTAGAVFWTADMDIDCDGRPGPECNSRTDPLFSSLTAYQQSDGRYLSAETLPYIVVPGVSAIWDHRADGVHGGSVAAVIYQGRVQYAVVGDTGPRGIIGEASYATAKALGIRPDPRGGGTPSGVTYIVFKDSRVTPIESHASAVEVGERLARLFVRRAGGAGGAGGAALLPAPAASGGVTVPPSEPPTRGEDGAPRQPGAADHGVAAVEGGGEATVEESTPQEAVESEGPEAALAEPEDAEAEEQSDDAAAPEARDSLDTEPGEGGEEGA